MSRTYTDTPEPRYVEKAKVIEDLPIASTEKLGAIKVGDNLSITSAGVLSADAATLEPATTEVLGGIIVGDNLSITETGVLSASASESGIGIVKLSLETIEEEPVISADKTITEIYELVSSGTPLKLYFIANEDGTISQVDATLIEATASSCKFFGYSVPGYNANGDEIEPINAITGMLFTGTIVDDVDTWTFESLGTKTMPWSEAADEGKTPVIDANGNWELTQ